MRKPESSIYFSFRDPIQKCSNGDTLYIKKNIWEKYFFLFDSQKKKAMLKVIIRC